MKKIGIIGTRKRNDAKTFRIIEEEFLKIYKEGDWIISGGCPQGGDRFAEILAKKYAVPILIFYPDWKKYGRGGGIVRNTSIAEHSSKLIASVSDDRKGGTEDTIEKFKKLHPKSKVILC